MNNVLNALRKAYGQFVYEKILENLDDLTDIELIEAISEFAPHLLNEED